MYYNTFVNRRCAKYQRSVEFYNGGMGKKKSPAVVYLEILPTSQSKRSEGLDILARLIARDIMMDNSHPLRRHRPQGKEDK